MAHSVPPLERLEPRWRFTHLTQHVRQAPGLLGLQGVGHQGVQADARLLLAFLLVLHLVAAEETQSKANTPGRKER